MLTPRYLETLACVLAFELVEVPIPGACEGPALVGTRDVLRLEPELLGVRTALGLDAAMGRLAHETRVLGAALKRLLLAVALERDVADVLGPTRAFPTASRVRVRVRVRVSPTRPFPDRKRARGGSPSSILFSFAQSQRIIVWLSSCPTEAIVLPDSEKATVVTPRLWPCRVALHSKVVVSQILTTGFLPSWPVAT